MQKHSVKYLALPILALVFFGAFFVLTDVKPADAQGTYSCEWEGNLTCGTLSPDACEEGYKPDSDFCDKLCGDAFCDANLCDDSTDLDCIVDCDAQPDHSDCEVEEDAEAETTGTTECTTLSPDLTFNVNWPRIGVGTNEDGSVRMFSLNELTGDDLNLENLINWLYAFFVWIAGIVAFISIVVAGFSFVFSGANPGIRAKAKERMRNTLIGIAIVFLVVLFVNVINPDALTLRISGMSDVHGTCPNVSLVLDSNGGGGGDDDVILEDNHSGCFWETTRSGGVCREIDRCDEDSGYKPDPRLNCSDIEDPDECNDKPKVECVKEGDIEEEDPEEAGTFSCSTDETGTACRVRDDQNNCNEEEGFIPDYDRCKEDDMLTPMGDSCGELDWQEPCCGGDEVYTCIKEI